VAQSDPASNVVPFQPDSSSGLDWIVQQRRQAQATAITSLDDNPDDAAKAQDLSDATGTHPALVYGDLDNFQQQHKAALTSQLLQGNGHLRDYVNSHPLAAKVSNDDWGNLDQFSQTLSNLWERGKPKSTFEQNIAETEPSQVLGKFARPGAEAFGDAFQGKPGDWTEPVPGSYAADLKARYPQAFGGAQALATLFGLVPEAMVRLGAGLTGAAVAPVLQAATDAGINAPTPSQFMNEVLPGLIGIHTPEMAEGEAVPDAVKDKAGAETGDALRAAGPWIQQGELPPVGVHPLIDQAHIELAKQDAKALGDALKDAVATSTRERAPGLLADFAQQHTGDATIGIKADAIRELYGTKAPDANDGLLGWIPGLQDKLSSAEITGGDVQVPVSEYLAHIESEVHKELEDHIRVREGGFTPEEVKEYGKIEEGESPKGEVKITPTEFEGGKDLVTGADIPKQARKSISVGDTEVGGADLLQYTDGTIGIQSIKTEPEFQRQGYASALMDDITKEFPDNKFRTSPQTGEGHQLFKSLGVNGLEFETKEGKIVRQGDRQDEAVNSLRQQASLEPKDLEPRAVGAAVTPKGDRELPEEPFAGAAPGFTKKLTDKYLKAIEERRAIDFEKANARAVAEQRKRLSPEWNANRVGVRNEVVQQVQSEPAWNLNERLLAGNKIDPIALSDEEKASLPKNYLGKGGLHVDDLDAQYGVDGHVLVAQLAAIERERKESGLRGMDFRRKYIDNLTDTEMEKRYGNFEKQVMDEALDQTLSKIQEQILHEQTLFYAEKAGAQFPLKTSDIRSALEDAFGEAEHGTVSAKAYMNDAGRAGRAAAEAALDQKWGEAFRQSQRQQLAMMLAREARDFEKEKAKFQKLIKSASDRTNPRVDQEYTNWMHDLMSRAGLKVGRSAGDLADTIAQTGHKSLRDFVEHKEVHDLRELPIVDFLKDPSFDLRKGQKDFDNLSVNEFRDFHNALVTLNHNGRDEKKIEAQGNAADLAEVKSNLTNSLDRYKEKAYDFQSGKRIEVAHKPRQFMRNAVVSHLGMETLLDNIDRYDSRGPWNQYVYRPLIEGANTEASLIRETGAKLRQVRDLADMKEMIPTTSPFIDPQTGLQKKLSREGLRSVLLNMGNKSNFHKLAGGWFNASDMAKADPKVWKAELNQFKQQITDWAHGSAMKEDWDWAQKIWDTLADLGDKSDRMYRQLSGVAPERLKVEPIDTPHGTYDGGYYPLQRHPLYGQDESLRKGDLMGEGFYRSMTAEGYTKKRTGALYPLALNLDQLPNTIAQIIHNVALRPAAVEVGKLVYDTKLNQSLKMKLGEEYANMFQPWLKDIVNSRNFSANKTLNTLFRSMDLLRSNIQVSLIGLNPSTVLKHGPTAMASSIAELGVGGVPHFVNALRSLYAVNDETGLSNVNFAKTKSEEMQRRFQSWVETLTGSHQEMLNGTGTWKQYQNWMAEMATKPVAYSDMLSSTSMWLAKYKMEMQEHGVEGDAVYAADKSVRRAHGSTATPARPDVLRTPALRWFTGFMTFMNDLLNRNIETLWRAGEAVGMAKEGQYGQAMSQVPNLMGRVLAYTIAPAVIEELVTGQTNSQNEGWGYKAASAIGHTLSAGVIGVRDIVDALINARDPSVGLLSTLYKTTTDPFRDLTAKDVKPGNVIKHGVGLAGALTGVPLQIGRTAEFVHGAATGQERPKGPWGWLVGLRYGTLKNHSPTFDKWWEGK
jgi:GNAT superfamily N-acetyltransferase